MSKYTALFRIHTPEYFTSLAEGIARGPFDKQGLRSDFFPVSGACRIPFVCLGCYGNEADTWLRSEGAFWSMRQSLLTVQWESPSMGNAVQGDNYGGNFVLFSKLIFKAIPEAHLLLLV